MMVMMMLVMNMTTTTTTTSCDYTETIRAEAPGDPRSIESIKPSGNLDRSSRSSPRGAPIDRVDRALGDTRSIDSSRSSRSSPKGSPIDPVDRALGDPRSIESIEPLGIPDRSSRFDRDLRDPRSIDSSRSSRSRPKGSPLREPRSIDSSRSSPWGSPIDRFESFESIEP